MTLREKLYCVECKKPQTFDTADLYGTMELGYYECICDKCAKRIIAEGIEEARRES